MEREKIYKNSPIFYLGSKYRLIQRGLTGLFPKNINTFVELFCGGCSISMNTTANKYILNDKNDKVIGLLELFKNNDSNIIINKIEEVIKRFNLLKGYEKKNKTVSEERKEEAKKNYLIFRQEYNKTKDYLYLYVLTYYCMNNAIRFNNSHEFNMPLGNAHFTKEKHSQKIIDGCSFFSRDNILLKNNDFRDLSKDVIKKLCVNDFVYLDPPYYNTEATYNERNGWSLKDDEDVFTICEELNSRGIKWGLSNVFENKGKTNQHLIDWCEKNNWNVSYFEGFKYSSFGRGESNTKEVYICNYNPNQ